MPVHVVPHFAVIKVDREIPNEIAGMSFVTRIADLKECRGLFIVHPEESRFGTTTFGPDLNGVWNIQGKFLCLLDG